MSKRADKQVRNSSLHIECSKFPIQKLLQKPRGGAGIELPQFESTDRLERVIGILSVIAAVLLQLRQQARDPQSEQTPAVDCVPLGIETPFPPSPPKTPLRRLGTDG